MILNNDKMFFDMLQLDENNIYFLQFSLYEIIIFGTKIKNE
jgi:hypothetical protein